MPEQKTNKNNSFLLIMQINLFYHLKKGHFGFVNVNIQFASVALFKNM